MKKKLLLVDDEPDVILALQFRLEQEGFEVLIASDGLEALEVLRSQTPDLVVMDVMMPGENGYRVSRLIREGEKTSGGHRRTPILLLTARDLRDDPERERIFMDFCGADEVIYKPFELEEVLGRIEALCTAPETRPRSAFKRSWGAG